MIGCSWDVVIPTDFCDWDDYSQQTKDSALWLASTYLWAATGRRFGPCPVTVRPSQGKRAEVAYRTFPVSAEGTPGVGPFLFSGRWFNAGCASACCGQSACAVVLRGPVLAIDEVRVDGDVVDPSAYRVDVTGGAWLLVRTDGRCWPSCQNMAAEPDEDDTFEITYDIGEAIPEALAIATALLACEYGKHLTGGACALPAQMTRLSRQGVELEVTPPDPATGKTGISLVDNVVWSLNPAGRLAPPRVMSLDLPETCDRVTVLRGGS